MKWFSFMREEQHLYDACVRELSYSESKCDRVCTQPCTAVLLHRCVVCPAPQPAFKSEKALASHMRVKHGCRSQMRFYTPSDGICLACKTNFQTRLRLLAHLVDVRRPRCRDQILLNRLERLSDEEVKALDLLDREARRNARRAGHTTALAVLPAVRRDGRIVGRCQ